GKFVEVNNEACRRLGYSRAELLNLKPFHIDSEEHAQITSQRIEHIKTKGQLVFESAHRTKNGQIIPVEVSSRLIDFEDRQCILSITRDITERKEAEFEIQKLSRALEQSPVSVIITDAAGNIEYVNPKYFEIKHHTCHEVIGHKPHIFQAEYHKKESYEHMMATIKGGKSWQGEFRNKNKEGQSYWEYSTIGPLKNEEGSVTHYIIMNEDITEHKKLEVQFQQSQKMEAIGHLAGGIAHDFNNLLTIINGYSSILLTRLEPDQPHYKEIKQIGDAGQRAASLTNQLLAFSRKQIIKPRVLNLNDVVTETDKMLRRLIGEHIKFRTKLHSSLNSIEIDPGQIDQILINLAVNARDAMPDGGSLSIETDNVYLDDNYAKMHVAADIGHYVMLAVSDTGKGMDKKTQARIFEPFFTTKPKGSGTGLGLSTIYGIVKQNKGFIWVYSEPGRGTTFKIYLPVVQKEIKSLQTPERENQKLNGHETILIVEDEEAVRTFAANSLKNYGYTVLEAPDGKTALKIIESHMQGIDLVLSDVIMPGMNGKEIQNRMQKKIPQLKYMFMSGYLDNTIVHQGELEEGIHFIAKPFSSQTLLSQVRTVLDNGADNSTAEAVPVAETEIRVIE
ncbi:MAG: PAS domain S-box protein, partial [Caldithrix sp.]|nr:PAS domain S-box protein [Caldithrix sp.]